MKPTIGTCYFPEHWDENVWEEDARRMKDAGLDWVRIGEFSWVRIEPEEGKLQWEWLDRAIDVLAKYDLKIALCTPTATPPRWMIDKHPNMLGVDKDGRPRKFGSRRHYCFSHKGYREECGRIATLMGKRYGQHPAIQAWQVDNEYGCHDTIISYSNAARDEFRNWLAQKYQSPDALNRAWGNVFWSMDYATFEEVDLPNLTVTEPNPAHVMDFRRFSSDQTVIFNKLQADILRQYTDAPLAHNYMGRTTDVDHFDLGQDLDIASLDSYPIGFLEMISGASDAHKAKYLRQGDPDLQAFHHDLYRAVGKGRYWIMEQQPGPVNWARYNPAPLDGMVRLWSLEAIAHGAETVNYFRWRQAPFAQEQMHAGLLNPDSKDAQGIIEAKATRAALDEIGEVTQQQAAVALIFDYPSQWAWETQSQGESFDYFQLLFENYRSLRKMGVDVDIISSKDTELDGYKLVLVPGLFTLSSELAKKLEAFDGTILAGPRFNSKTEDFQIPVPLPPQLPGMELEITRVGSLRPGIEVALSSGGTAINWIEDLETDSQCLEKTADDMPILCRSDNWYYLGAWLDEDAMMRVFKSFLNELSIETNELAEGIRIRKTKEHIFVFNYASEPREFEGQKLPPAGVLWLETNQ